jgi:hypothetical protein
MTDQDLVPAEEKLKLLFEHRPWESEPSYADWVDGPTKYKCRIVRNDHTGTLCGYVGIPRGHRLYGVSYQDAEKNFPFNIHGGLTYSGSIEDADDGYHYFGFDTAHGGDFSPKLVVQMLRWANTEGAFHHYKYEEYRTFEYVQREVMNLALQLLYFDKRGKSYD